VFRWLFAVTKETAKTAEFATTLSIGNLFFEYSLDLMVLVGLDGSFKQVSPSFERTLGWTKKEVISKRFMDFIHPDDRQKTVDEGKGVGVGKDVARVETRYLCKDGSYKWISWSSTRCRKNS
jgi:PAS domain S-box-containing protein